MTLPIYNAVTSSSHSAARAYLIAHVDGDWSGWNLDVGRMEDGIAETLRTETLKGDHLSVPFAADDSGCSHGIYGIFGYRFAEALAADPRTLILDVDFYIDAHGLTFTGYRLSLV